MHDAVRQWISKIKRTYPSYFVGGRVLEIGARNVNGSAREFFRAGVYVGIDLVEGEGVDLVSSAVEYAQRGERFNVIVCTETLEHDAQYAETLRAAVEMLEPYGLLIVTAAGPMRPEHGTHAHAPEDSPATLDYYGNISEPMLAKAVGLHHFIIHELTYSADQTDLYFYGIKR